MTDLLSYIDQIDQATADAEISVLESLIASYDKSIMIIQESADDVDLSAFDIFQEGEKWDKFKEDTKAPVLGNKGESLIKRLLMLIPRLIQKLVALIRKLIVKDKSAEQKMKNDVDDLKTQSQKTVAEPLTPEQTKAVEQQLSKSNQQDPSTVRNLDNLDTKVKELNKTNPEMIDKILADINEPPREKRKLEDWRMRISGAKLFSYNSFDSANEIFKTDAFADIPLKDIKALSFDIIPTGKPNDLTQIALGKAGTDPHIDVNEVDELRKLLGERIQYLESGMQEFSAKGTKQIDIKYGDAIRSLDVMRNAYTDFTIKARMYTKFLDQLASQFMKRTVHLNESLRKVNQDAADTKHVQDELQSIEKCIGTITLFLSTYNKYTTQVQSVWNEHASALRMSMKEFELNDWKTRYETGTGLVIQIIPYSNE
jgi:hypothetical protein